MSIDNLFNGPSSGRSISDKSKVAISLLALKEFDFSDLPKITIAQCMNQLDKLPIDQAQFVKDYAFGKDNKDDLFFALPSGRKYSPKYFSDMLVKTLKRSGYSYTDRETFIKKFGAP